MESEKNHISENQLIDSVYAVNPLSKSYIFLGALSLILGIILNIPLKEKIADFITAKLASMESCPIFYERLEVGSFIQKINLDGPIISGSCLGRQSNLRFDKIEANLSLPSLFPPGIRTHLTIHDGKSVINLYPVVSYPEISLEITDTDIQGPLLEKILGGWLKLTGNFNIQSDFKLEKNDLMEGAISLLSKNLAIPRQNISGFNIPTLLLRTFAIKGNITKINTFNFSSITIGDKDSMIFTQLKGQLQLDRRVLNQSLLDLTGKIRISKEFISMFPILNLLLSGKNPGPEGLYNIKIQGPLASVKPSIF